MNQIDSAARIIRTGKFWRFSFLLLVTTFLFSCTRDSAPQQGSSRPPAPEPGQQSQRRSLEKNLESEERAEIRETLDRIFRGERRYRQDGIVFQNREERLPLKPQGYYREYTVETRGSKSRGVRRLVIGKGGETYYTNDHYQSFLSIDPLAYN